MLYARISDGLVAELVDLTVPPAEAFHPTIAAALEPCGEDVAQGWTWDGETFAAPAGPSLADLKAARLAMLATRRWQAETGGITVAGVAVPTDRTTQDRVDQIVKAYDDGDIAGDIDFKAGGLWVSLTEAQLRAIKAAGAQHIQSCFSNERALAEAVEAAADETALSAIDLDAGWPE